MNDRTRAQETARRIELFSLLVRHLTAIVYILAELVLGFKPEKL